MRRAFTLLEVVLAMAIGSIVVVTSLGLLASMDRTDTRLEVRHRQRVELSRTRSTIQRAMTSLVMDDTTPITDPNADRPRPPVRMDLRISPSDGARRAFRRARMAGVDLGEPQRFEVVVSRPPTLLDSPMDRRTGRAGDRDDDSDVAALRADDQRPTYRGAFELWPDGTVPGTPGAERAWAGARGMTLWWRPEAPPDATPEEAAGVGSGVPLASGLVACQWHAFRNSERKSVYSATWVTELPGYVEFEARTSMGLHVNWMFEILWTEGPEGVPAGQRAGEGEDEGEPVAPGGGPDTNVGPGGDTSTGGR